MTALIQRSFAGGEISSDVYGRADLTKWQTGLALCKNFIVQRAGSLTNRTGTRHVCAVKDSSDNVRLLKFKFNSSQTYILEFGDYYMRIIKSGKQLGVSGLTAWNSGTSYVAGDMCSYSGLNYYAKTSSTNKQPDTNPTEWYSMPADGTYEIPTPYAHADLAQLTYKQSGDIITICHTSYAPRNLSRTGDTSWTFSTTSVAPTTAAPTGVSISGSAGGYGYVVTSVNATTYEESYPSSAVTADTTYPKTLSWSNVSGAREYNIYKRKQATGEYGYIGTVTGTPWVESADINPDFTDTPPENPDVLNGAGEYPAAVGYYQQRRVFGGSTNEPEKLWLSQTGLYGNFTTHFPLVSSDSVSFTLAGEEVNRVRHIVQQSRLMAFTEGGVWIIKGDADGAITPTDINSAQASFNGVGDVPPLVVNDTVLYVEDRSAAVRDFSFDFSTEGAKSDDLTIFATHLFENKSITSWDYSRIPHSVIWAARSDGKMLGFTYIREHQVWAWHQHETDGTVLDVCVVPEGDIDRPYFVVTRGGTKYIEYLTDPFNTGDISDAWYVDQGFVFNGGNQHSQVVDSTISTVAAPSSVSVTLDLLSTSGTVDDVVKITTTGASADLVGDEYVITDVNGLEASIKITQYISATDIRGTPTQDIPADFIPAATTNYVHKTHRITGISALNGASCSALCDGSVVRDVTVSGGVATFVTAYEKIVIGRQYNSDMKTLGVENVQGETLVGKTKNIKNVTILVKDSRGVYAGQDEDNLDEAVPEDSLDDLSTPPALVTGTISSLISSTWDDNGAVFIRQSDPLPLTVLAVAYEGKAGG